MEQTSIIHNGEVFLWGDSMEGILEWVQAEEREAMARQEIAEAIKAVQCKGEMDSGRKRIRIRVLPSLPDYRYVYTCPRCKSHGLLRAFLHGGSLLNLCAGCEWIYGLEER